MKKPIAFLALLVGALSGCANSSVTYGQDGRVAHSINCSGTARNWGMCQQKAGELCGAKGYEVLSSTSDNGMSAVATNQLFTASTITTRTMLVSCKP